MWLVFLANLPAFHQEHHHEIGRNQLTYHDQNCEDPAHHFEMEDCVYCKNAKENNKWTPPNSLSFGKEKSYDLYSFSRLIIPLSKKESFLTRAPPVVA